jgi:hypothetical protein
MSKNNKIYFFSLILAFSLLFFLSAKLLDHKIVHGYPYGYLASDAFWDLTEIEYLKDVGKYKYEPPWKCGGFKDCFGFTVPVWYHVGSKFSIISGLDGYAMAPFLPLFFSVIVSLVIFLIICKINKKLAFFSIPLFFFLYSKNFKILYLWGYWDVILGNLFLVCAALCLFNLDKKRMEYALGIFIAGTFITHLLEFFYLSGFIAIYVIYAIFNKEGQKLKKISIAYVSFFIISSYFIVNQYIGTFSLQSGGSISFQAAGKLTEWWVPKFMDFGFLFWIILLGIVLILLKSFNNRKKESGMVYLFFAYLVFLGFWNYLPLGLFGSRASQARFLWPIFASLALGIVLFQVFSIISKVFKVDKNILFLAIFLILLLLGFFYINKSVQAAGSMMNPASWNAFLWLRENTPEESEIFYVYGDYYSQTAYLLSGHRTPYLLVMDSITEHLKNKKITNDIRIRVGCCTDTGFSYRSSFLSLTPRMKEENYDQFMNRSDFCDYDYYFFDKFSRYNELGYYNNVLYNFLIDNLGFERIFENEFVIILEKPSELKGRCLPDEGINL